MKSKITVLLLACLLLTHLTFAHAGPQESAEAIAIRVLDIDAATNTYTFECTIPQDYVQQYYWSSRETDLLETEFSTPNNEWTWQLDEKQYYHIGCGAYDAQGVWNLYDVHIDLREQRDTTKPILTVLSSNGSSVNARCDVPADLNNYRLEWVWNSEAEHETMSEYGNQQMVTFEAPSVQLWELACNIINLDDFSDWRNDASTMEFFKEGPAYVPNRLGCMPWECGTVEPFVGLLWEPVWSQGASGLLCGNFIVESGEQCDDGNSVNGDGCSSTCQTETEGPICGNGIVEEGEACDDGNTDSGDGCSALCQLEENNAMQCFGSVADIPLSCTGIVSSDTFNGCRTVVCSGKQILACDKSGHFEMYNQGGSSLIEICLGEVCMSNQGYMKSSDFPICVEGSEQPEPSEPEPTCGDGVVNQAIEQCDDGNVVFGDGCSATCDIETQNNESRTCFENIETIPVSCSGTISSDTFNGCRTIVCSGKQILACDKSGHFEMYNQGGSSSVEICLGEVCMTNQGFIASGPYPLCVEGGVVEGTPNLIVEGFTFTTTQSIFDDNGAPLPRGILTFTAMVRNNGTSSSSEDFWLSVFTPPIPTRYDEGFKGGVLVEQPIPAGVSVPIYIPAALIFELDTTYEFEATITADKYIEIGVQDNLINESNESDNSFIDTVFVRLDSTPYCGDGAVNQVSEQCDDNNLVKGDGCSATCQIEDVQTNSSVVLAIAPWFPQGNNVVLVCAADFDAISYDWYFGDGSSWIGSNRADVWHTYPGNGAYEASCVASDGAQNAQGELRVII